jgi:hypothetical protein
VLEEELAALESIGELLADRLFDDARPGEADERSRLRDVQIAEHGEARRHAARRRIRQHGDVGEPRPIESREGGADLGHLHQRQGPFHHPRAAGARDDDDGTTPFDRALDGPRDLLAHHNAHAAADEGVLHRQQHAFLPVDGTRCRDDGVLEPGGVCAGPQPFRVPLRVHERERIGRSQACIVLHEAPAVEQLLQPLSRANPEMVAALGADVQVGGEVLVEDGLRAAGALYPQTLGDFAGLRGRRLDRLAALLEPRHDRRA